MAESITKKPHWHSQLFWYWNGLFVYVLSQLLIQCVNFLTHFAIKLSQFHSHSMCSFVLIEIGILCERFCTCITSKFS